VPTGFIELALRKDYVEGTEESPVWYVEGIYVDRASRRLGVGGRLVEEVETITGADTLASDCELDNQESRLFHEALGFREVIRSILYIRKRN